MGYLQDLDSITPEWVDDKLAWSKRTFGPGARLKGVLAHIRKELAEVEASPKDADEWADVILLALDGAGRQGIKGRDLLRAIHDKQARNIRRRWPDWRGRSEGEPIEHDRSGE